MTFVNDICCHKICLLLYLAEITNNLLKDLDLNMFKFVCGIFKCLVYIMPDQVCAVNCIVFNRV